MFLIYRVYVNAMGDEHSPVRYGRRDNWATARSVAQSRSLLDRQRTETRWKVVRSDDLSVVCSFGPYRTAP